MSTAVADAGTVGKTLFIALEGNGVSNDSFSRVDATFLEVTAVPEPSSLALIGLGGLVLLRRRRK